jgi:hypothetical protein
MFYADIACLRLFFNLGKDVFSSHPLLSVNNIKYQLLDFAWFYSWWAVRMLLL